MIEKSKVYNQGFSLVIPAYNEENAIESTVNKCYEVLSSIEGLKFEIIVVDDGSKDKTSERVPTDKCHLISHPKNYGYGQSLYRGIQNAQYPYIGIIDADNTYDANDFKRMIPLMEVYDMVIGSRKLTNQSQTVSLMRKTLKALIYFFSEHYSQDPNSGIRVFKKSLVDYGGHLFSKRFSFSTSLTFFAALNYQFIEYIPIEYGDRTGVSKVRHLRDSIRTFILILTMAIIYRPLKCFSCLTILFISAIIGLFTVKHKINSNSFNAYVQLLGIATLNTAMSFLAFIMGKSYVDQLAIPSKRK